jgi:Cu(I)/Ag(I) efflux system membrane fusion protein
VAVSIPSEVRQRMGLTLGRVEKRSLVRNVRTSARIVVDETGQYRVTTKVDGWVEKLLVNVTGQAVKQGEPLLTIYAPALVAAQQEYLTALQVRDRLAATKNPAATAGVDDLLKATRQRFQLWDISEDQIQRLEKTRQVEKTLTLYAPAGGVVMEKGILAGQKIMAGDPLLVIADLRNVWADADIYQSDLLHVTVGMPVEVTLPYWPDKVFTGKVNFVTPTLDPATRTVRARLEVENSDLLLKPGMYADARLKHTMGERLVVPTDAVMRAGERAHVFKDGGDGKLMPVIVRIGTRSDGYFELLEGLQEGEQVVTSANFLVDSESSLKAALAAMSGAKTEGGDPHAGHRR